MPGAQYYDGKKITIPMSTQAGIDMYERWTIQALSSLISAIAQKESNNMNEFYRNKLFKCSRVSETIYEHSRCVFSTIDEASKKKNYSRANRLKMLNSILYKPEEVIVGKIPNTPFKVRHSSVMESRQLGQNESNTTIQKWSSFVNKLNQTVNYRSKRDIIRSNTYKLKSEYENITPVGILGKYFSQTMNIIKGKDDRTFSDVVASLKSIQEKRKVKQEQYDNFEKRFAYAKYGFAKIKKHKKLTTAEKELLTGLGVPSKVINQIEDAKNSDSVITSEILRIFKQAIKITAALSGDKKTAALVDKKKLRFASPRLLSVVPENTDNETINLLSPSVFSLHSGGKGLEKLTSLPNLVNSLNNTDFKDWLNFILEASGVTDFISELKKKEKAEVFEFPYKNFPRGIDGQPLYFTKENLSEIANGKEMRKVEVSEKLQKMLDRKQINDFSTIGYSVLNKEQLTMIYGEDSPYKNKEALNLFKSMSEAQLHEHIIKDLRKLGRVPHRHQKRSVIKSPVGSQSVALNPRVISDPLILSPVTFSLVLFSPTIVGASILSPSLFLAIILSPQVVTPVILAPSLFVAVILSPVAIQPIVLSPSLMVSNILSPNVMQPLILNPSLMAPTILSPYALSPKVLNPTAVVITALSPFVLSPNVYSPSCFVLLFMSPHAFSPNINSSSKLVTVILSPSAFS